MNFKEINTPEMVHKLKFVGCLTVLFFIGFNLCALLQNIEIPLIFAVGITIILLIFGISAFLIITQPQNDYDYEYDSDCEILFED